MTNNDGKSRPEPTEQADSLSATGMFLRAFETPADSGQQPSDPFAAMAEPVAVPKAPNLRDDILAPQPAPPSGGSSPQGPGSFTQMFSAVEPKRQAAPMQTPVREVVVPALPPPPPPAASRAPAAAPADQGAGEFTRIFVAGPTPAAPPQNKNVEETPRTTPAAAPSRAKGFSAPGVSGSVSGEGSFTQFFKATPPASTPRPAQASAAPSPLPPSPPAPSPKPSFEASWKDDPIFRQPAQPSNSGPSVTSLLSSLATPGRPAAGAREPEPAAYRPEAAPILASPPPSAQPSGGEAGGVTRLIQRLAHEPPAAAAPPPPPSAAPVRSGPGEFTRMIASLGPRPAAGESAPGAAAAAAPAAAAPPLPISVTFTPPAVPAMSMAAPPVIPVMQPPAAHVQGAPMPAMHAPVLPPLPKPAPPPLAVAAPKSKLEAMVPYLLVVNTFLLLVLLMVVVFLIKSK